MFKTFKSRLIGNLLIVNLCVLLLGAISYYFLGAASSRFDTFTDGLYHRLEIANRLRDAADTRALAVRNMVLLTDSAQRGDAGTVFAANQKEVADALRELEEAATQARVPPDVMARIRRISSTETAYAPVAQQIVDLIKAGQLELATARIQKECTPTLNELRAAIHDYMKINERNTHEFAQATSALTTWQRLAMLTIALSALALAAGLGWLLWRHVQQTLGDEPEQLKDVLQRMADGDLRTVVARGPVPAGSLLEAITRMRDQVRAVVEKVRLASDSIATASSEIAGGNSDLSQRTEHQASNLQRAASAMDQMNRTVQHNAQAVQTASGLADSVSHAAAGGSDVMGRVTETMAEISRSSARIADIIGTIDGIAFQTNILALNAAVEAARAGEQGRGFAVVAGEVRILAQRSADAAREIKSLITASADRVSAGTQLVGEAGHAVGDIVAEVQRVSELIQAIGRSAQEQSTGIAEVSASVSDLDQGTQQNAALAEQSAAAAESLRSQSVDLAAAVNYFKV